jgi:predicted DNA binding CopG/RHH family protein
MPLAKVKKIKGVQYLSEEYIKQTMNATPEQSLNFLEQYRLLQGAKSAKEQSSTAISIRIPDQMLATLKAKAELQGIKYQTLIKKLIQDYLDDI